MTHRERNFQLKVEELLSDISKPEYRQTVVEVYLLPKQNLYLRYKRQLVKFTQFITLSASLQTPVVQKANNFIQQISRYSVDKRYWLEYILSTG